MRRIRVSVRGRGSVRDAGQAMDDLELTKTQRPGINVNPDGQRHSFPVGGALKVVAREGKC